MDFNLSPEQQALADSVARFCTKDYAFEARKRIVDSADGFSRDHWKSFAELGWLGAGLSEEAGGFGGSAIENAVLMEQFGRALVLEPFLASAVLAQQTLAALPQGETRDRLIEEAVSGETILALAHGEPAARGDVEHVTTEAVPAGNGWRLTGHKSLVLGAPMANRLLVSARSPDGVGLFLVAPDAANLRLKPYRTLDNLRVADIWLDGAEAESVLAAPGEGMPAITKGVDHALIAVTAEAVGAMQAALLMTRDYLQTRKQFGTAIGNFQALQHRMADMLVELELSRSVLYQGLAAIDGTPFERVRAMSAMKAIVSSAAMFVGRNVIQLHGAIGMTEEYAIGHYYRRLFVIAAQFGNESLHLERLAANPVPFWPGLDLASQQEASG
jgi:alkylation response protein AidB-like acyl-CoA dehydrogenase